ncbi:DNRLRE domain-containing protein [Bacillus luteolus]|uniref:DNRLRE domain-containing protein n=1 Tax=Litchfieldia luteola TaxID=682179 RepID=A0ABR9QEN0_9BACI|nr:DNRLRE domain-containing protein [Cytobacillus luteolus]MBE4906951.1 DNRLRE domain-containing protein [Cytobacillus luteolus]MBP1943584.1 RHS repeat-associated protein [Cytobacillus luteolus]
MKNKASRYSQTIKVLLSIILLFASFPFHYLTVSAETTEEIVNSQLPLEGNDNPGIPVAPIITPSINIIEDVPLVKKREAKEAVELRTEKSSTIDNGDGTYTSSFYSNPIHTLKNNKFEKISPSFKMEKGDPTTVNEASNEDVVSENTKLGIRFAPVIHNGKYARFSYGNNKMTMIFTGSEGDKPFTKPTNVRASYEENQIFYKDVIPSITLRNIISDSEVKEDIILSSYQGYHTFEFFIDTELKGTLRENGEVVFSFPDGEEQLVFPKPYMVDSNIDSQTGEPEYSENVHYELTKEQKGYVVKVVADANWLKDSKRVYPVYIDPTTKLQTSKDTFVSSAYRTTNYDKFWDNAIGSYVLKVGYVDDTTGFNYAYVQQDVSSIQYSTINTALFNLYTVHSYQPTTPTEVWIDKVTESWQAGTLNWNNMPSQIGISNNQVSVHKGQWASFNVKDTVQSWVNNPSTNHGFKVHTKNHGYTHWKKFYASEHSNVDYRPHLNISYSYPAPASPTATTGYTVDKKRGFVDLTWNPVQGASGYYISIYNGVNYEKIDVGNVTKWSTLGKGIWPTDAEIFNKRYQLHITDSNGTDLPFDPSPVYRNSGGQYTKNQNYWFRISAKYPNGQESLVSDAAMPTIPLPTVDTPHGIAHVDASKNDTGYVNLKWNPVPGASGYKVWVWNGEEYQAIKVGNVTEWSTRGQKIWPTSGHTLSNDDSVSSRTGTDLSLDPTQVYKDAFQYGTITNRKDYSNDLKYYFRISAYNENGNQSLNNSEAFYSKISSNIGFETTLPMIDIAGGWVNAKSGNIVLPIVDFSLGNKGDGIAFKRTYNHHLNLESENNWFFSFNMNIQEQTNGNILYKDSDGTLHHFKKLNDETYEITSDITLSKISTGYIIGDYEGEYTFDLNGHLIGITDNDSNNISITRVEEKLLITSDSGENVEIYTSSNQIDYILIKNQNLKIEYIYSEGSLATVKYSDLNKLETPNEYQVQYIYEENKLSVLLPNHFSPNKPVENEYKNIYVFNDNRLTQVVVPVSEINENSIIERKQIVTNIEYDILNRITKKILPKGNINTLNYDLNGIPVNFDEKSLAENKYSIIYDITKRTEDEIQDGYKFKLKRDLNGNIIYKETSEIEWDQVNNKPLYDTSGELIVKNKIETREFLYDEADRLIETKERIDEKNEITGEIEEKQLITKLYYDLNSNLIKVIQPNNASRKYDYNSNEQINLSYINGNLRYKYLYENGILSQVEDLALNIKKDYNYNVDTNELLSLNLYEYGTINWRYNIDENLEVLTIIDKNANQYSIKYLNQFDTSSHTKTITDLFNGNEFILTMNQIGDITSIKSGNNISSVYSYDENNLLKNLQINKTDGSLIASYSYEKYDGNGNILDFVSNGENIQYIFDDKNQIKKVNINNNEIYEYQYDNQGNILSKTYSKNASLIEKNEYSYVSDYNGNRIDTINGVSIDYNLTGEIESDQKNKYQWNELGQLVKVFDKESDNLLASFKYDEEGRRIEKDINGNKTRYIYNGDSVNVLYETDELGKLLRYYTYDDVKGTRLSVTDITKEGTYFYHYNHHGDVIAISNENQEIIARYEYDVWGKVISKTGTYADENPYRFSGYYYDKEIYLYYLTSRYYHPEHSIFLSRDSMTKDVHNLSNINVYSYAKNNPVSFNDPSGETFTWALRQISNIYSKGVVIDEEASLMIFGANAIAPGRYRNIYVPLHEIAQVNIAKKLGQNAILEQRIGKYEADVVLGKELWEVKPISGKDPKNQLEKYTFETGYVKGHKLKTINDITVLGEIKMEITFPKEGEARYRLYYKKNGVITTLTTVYAAKLIIEEIIKRTPAGRKLAPAF